MLVQLCTSCPSEPLRVPPVKRLGDRTWFGGEADGPGERVIRVPAAVTGQARRVSRRPGKSDPIDARAVALAVVRDGIESFPPAFCDEQTMEIRLLCDDLRVARLLLKRIAEIGRAHHQRLTALTSLIDAHAPQLIAQPGCGTVTAAIIIGHTAGSQRFPTDGHFARNAGTAPIPASSSNIQRHRLHRGGDRQLNRAIHSIALSRARTDPETRAYLVRKHAGGKTKLEAIRCLKRHLARR